MPLHDLIPILIGWAIAIASPGPATLAISGTALSAGRARGLAVALGVVTGSAVWALVAGLGLGAVMLGNAWMIEALRYGGAAYLAWLAWKSARSALQSGAAANAAAPVESLRRAWARGALIHLTNPKAALFWGAIFAVVIPAGSPASVLWQVGLSCLGVSVVTFTLMALAFSSRPLAWAWLRARRVFDAAFALLFGLAALRVLTARLTPA